MHTNYDVIGMADLSADYLKLQDTKVLTVTDESGEQPEGFGRVGKLPRAMPSRCARLRRSGSEDRDCGNLYRKRKEHDP